MEKTTDCTAQWGSWAADNDVHMISDDMRRNCLKIFLVNNAHWSAEHRKEAWSVKFCSMMSLSKLNAKKNYNQTFKKDHIASMKWEGREMRSVTFVDRLTLEVTVSYQKVPHLNVLPGGGYCCTKRHLSWGHQWWRESWTDCWQWSWGAIHLQGV